MNIFEHILSSRYNMLNVLKNIINPHDKKLEELEKRVQTILDLENQISVLSDEELRNKTLEFKNRLSEGQTLDNILEEAFAVVREASFRVLGLKHYPVQLMGGIVLHEGNIAQMQTGEGKTLVATLPSYLNALTGDGVWVITVNDYLASRDKDEMGRIHEFLGLKVGFIYSQMNLIEKKQAYNCDIVYGTNSEYGFDYLKDNMAIVKDSVVQRKLNYAIIDEIDSILIDEARTPLIITTIGTRPSEYYMTVDKFIKSLDKDDYEIDNEKHMITLSDSGMDKVEKIFGITNISNIKNVELLHHIRQSLYGNYMMKKDKDYVVLNGEILIVDKFTGRLMPGRRFSNGLHQAIEAKENVEVQRESSTCATITYQNYFRMFNKICGMTGTAYTEKSEFKDIYGMDVICIPTNKPTQRIDKEDCLYKTKDAKLNAIADEVKERNEKGQPILLGTIYIDESEKLSELLTKRGVKHNLLNAKQDKNEAEIIAMAGQRSSVTIATNMAGRGTDIKLGEGVNELGGLYVIGSERHDSRRIDNQLRGRSARQGDNGESRFFISLEDSLFDKIDKEMLNKIKFMVEKLNLQDDEAIEDKLVSKSIEGVQKSIEGINYRVRKSTLEFDQILNKQRETIYAERNKILNGEDMSSFIKECIKDVVYKGVDECTKASEYAEEWDIEFIDYYFNNAISFNGRLNLHALPDEEIEKLTRKTLKEYILDIGLNIYTEKESLFDNDEFRYIERVLLMKRMDERWVEHLDIVEQIRQGISFQYVGGQDPVRVFNEESFNLFDDMLHKVKIAAISSIFDLLSNEKENQEKIKIEQEEQKRKENVLELEDRYKIDRKNMHFVYSNMPSLKFTIDINAVDEINGKVCLYYMDNGYEEKLSEHEKSIKINGKFEAKFDLISDNWNEGWYQVKTFVSSQEVSTINFLIVKPLIKVYECFVDGKTIVSKLNADIEENGTKDVVLEFINFNKKLYIASTTINLTDSNIVQINFDISKYELEKDIYQFRILSDNHLIYHINIDIK